MRLPYILLPLLLTLPLAGCPKKEKDKNDVAPPPATHDDARYIPMGADDRWVYETSTWFGEHPPVHGGEELFQVLGNATLNGVDTVLLTTLLGNDWPMGQQRYLRITTQGLWEYFPPDSPFSTLANPFQLLRFPLVSGDHFVAFSERNEGSVEDLDEDGIPESHETRITVTVIGQESVSTPVGDFTGAWKVNRRAEWLTHYSTGYTSGITSTVDEWLARDIGLVKRDAIFSIGGDPGETPVLYGQHHTLLRYDVNGIRSETTPPSIQRLSPAADSTHPAAPYLVQIDFDELLDASSVDNGTIVLRDEGGTPVEGEANINFKHTTFQPASALVPGLYTARVEGIADALGNTMPPHEWTFRIVPVEDCYEGDVYLCSVP